MEKEGVFLPLTWTKAIPVSSHDVSTASIFIYQVFIYENEGEEEDEVFFAYKIILALILIFFNYTSVSEVCVKKPCFLRLHER